MKRLLLASLLCLSAFAGLGQAPEASAACDIWLRREYYTCDTRVHCGSTYFRCEATNIVNGCQTACFVNVRSACSCA